jgi:putative membrane protein
MSREVRMMMWGIDDWGWGALMMIVFWVLAVLLVWALVRSGSRPQGPDEPDALNVLAARFARGEIDEEEYERRRRTLQRTG